MTDLFEVLARVLKNELPIQKIIRHGRATIVLWGDGTKTVVKRRYGETDDQFTAVCVAIAKHAAGSGKKLRELVDRVEVQYPDMDADGASAYEQGYHDGYHDGREVVRKAAPSDTKADDKKSERIEWSTPEPTIFYPHSTPPDWYEELFNGLYDKGDDE